MVCCLAVANHYLNQCWLPTIEAFWYSLKENFSEDEWVKTCLKEFKAIKIIHNFHNVFIIIQSSFEGVATGNILITSIELRHCQENLWYESLFENRIAV